MESSGLWVYVTFFLFLKIDWQSQFSFSENSFSEELASYWLLTLYVTCFFPTKISSLHWTGTVYFCKEKLWQKVAHDYQMLWSPFFQKRLTLLYQSMKSQTRWISHLYSSALFTNSLSWYWCYILTLQALMCIKRSWKRTGGPIWNFATGTLAP